MREISPSGVRNTSCSSEHMNQRFDVLAFGAHIVVNGVFLRTIAEVE
jgi:hypothetical protein